MELGDSSGTDLFVHGGLVYGRDRLPAMMRSLDVSALPLPLSRRGPSVWLLTLRTATEATGADILSLGRHPKGLLRLPLGQGLHRGSPLTAGVITGDGQYC